MSADAARSGSPAAARRIGRGSGNWSARLAWMVRWLHLYLSMAAFGTMLLFSVTGLTLNHPEWFAAGIATSDLSGTLDAAILGGEASADDPRGALVDRLAVAEILRARHGLLGSVADFRSDEREATVGWKGPGYSADAVVERATGRYTLTVTRHGVVDILNDLHKGRDTGRAWSLLIDISAIVMVIAAVTGFLLVFWIRRRRLAGIVVAVLGMLAVLATAVWLVP